MTIALIGASGRLGSLILELLKEHNIKHKVLDRETLSNQNLFADFITENSKDPLVILDVSLPKGTCQLLENILVLSKQKNTAQAKNITGLVIGTTGHGIHNLNLIKEVQNLMPVLLKSNFSKGVYLFEEMLKAKTHNGLSVVELARQLGFDLTLHEIHHTKKKDAPSGTALTLASKADIEISKITAERTGDVIGEHTITAKGHFEHMSITHSAHSRKAFALGAIDLCLDLIGGNTHGNSVTHS